MVEAAGEDPAVRSGGDDRKAAEGRAAPRKQGRGFFSRIWRGIFGERSEDYEKKLRSLSKEEASVQARMKRRGLTSHKMARNIIVLSVIAEVVAVAYAIMTIRSLELNWQMRAVRVLPMFVLPGLSFVIYSTVVGFTRMLDRKDQKTLERLRAETKAKIDELKEITNYYTTQQLIQRYDLDPAAKAAAASVLASKLGDDSGLRVHVGDGSETRASSVKSNDVELLQSSGLRNRSTASSVRPQVMDSGEVAVQSHKVVEHYRGSGTNDGGWIVRIASLLVGEDPTKSCALICGNCRMHNGLARKEDFMYITYYCPRCCALNQSRQSGEQESGSSSPPAQGDGNCARNTSNITSSTNESKVANEVPATGQ